MLNNDTVAICIAAGGVVSAVIGGVWKLAQSAKTLTAKISSIEEDSYTLPRAAEVALRTAIENPHMRVPDPRSPNQIIQVNTR